MYRNKVLKRISNNKGVALITVVMVFVVVSIFSMLVIYVASSDNVLKSIDNIQSENYYIAWSAANMLAEKVYTIAKDGAPGDTEYDDLIVQLGMDSNGNKYVPRDGGSFTHEIEFESPDSEIYEATVTVTNTQTYHPERTDVDNKKRIRIDNLISFEGESSSAGGYPVKAVVNMSLVIDKIVEPSESLDGALIIEPNGQFYTSGGDDISVLRHGDPDFTGSFGGSGITVVPVAHMNGTNFNDVADPKFEWVREDGADWKVRYVSPDGTIDTELILPSGNPPANIQMGQDDVNNAGMSDVISRIRFAKDKLGWDNAAINAGLRMEAFGDPMWPYYLFTSELFTHPDAPATTPNQNFYRKFEIFLDQHPEFISSVAEEKVVPQIKIDVPTDVDPVDPTDPDAIKYINLARMVSAPLEDGDGKRDIQMSQVIQNEIEAYYNIADDSDTDLTIVFYYDYYYEPTESKWLPGNYMSSAYPDSVNDPNFFDTDSDSDVEMGVMQGFLNMTLDTLVKIPSGKHVTIVFDEVFGYFQWKTGGFANSDDDPGDFSSVTFLVNQMPEERVNDIYAIAGAGPTDAIMANNAPDQMNNERVLFSFDFRGSSTKTYVNCPVHIFSPGGTIDAQNGAFATPFYGSIYVRHMRLREFVLCYVPPLENPFVETTNVPGSTEYKKYFAADVINPDIRAVKMP
ncbi:MAG: hypothetical protein LBS21_03750 [Clostridiales bacterium]|jgi:hypothetical protein|nr:hypothetical protein [Clostridiales bacterium]